MNIPQDIFTEVCNNNTLEDTCTIEFDKNLKLNFLTIKNPIKLYKGISSSLQNYLFDNKICSIDDPYLNKPTITKLTINTILNIVKEDLNNFNGIYLARQDIAKLYGVLKNNKNINENIKKDIDEFPTYIIRYIIKNNKPIKLLILTDEQNYDTLINSDIMDDKTKIAYKKLVPDGKYRTSIYKGSNTDDEQGISPDETIADWITTKFDGFVSYEVPKFVDKETLFHDEFYIKSKYVTVDTDFTQSISLALDVEQRFVDNFKAICNNLIKINDIVVYNNKKYKVRRLLYNKLMLENIDDFDDFITGIPIELVKKFN
jgi:hypothetical protein